VILRLREMEEGGIVKVRTGDASEVTDGGFEVIDEEGTGGAKSI
jgi:hypothetical protein